MSRQFPLIRTFNNLVWNIRHYQPPSKMPPFKASRHPFCTNIQLRDVSYAYWFEETSRDLRQKLVSRKSDFTRTKDELQPRDRLAIDSDLHAPILSCAQSGVEDLTQTQQQEFKPEISSQEIEIVRLFQMGRYSDMYIKLKQYKAANCVIPTHLLNEMASRAYNDLPADTVEPYLLQSVVEPPAFYLENDLRYSKFSTKTRPCLKYLQKSFSLYEDIGLPNDKFLQHYIWLSYHEGDFQVLQRLLYLFLQRPFHDSRSLSYIINAHVYNYDVTFSKSLFESIVAMNKPLAESLFSSTIIAFVKVGALYDNLYDLVQLWLASGNCESPYPKTVALLLEQTARYGTEQEIASIDEVCKKLGYDNNFLVHMVRTQTRILLRDRNQKKTLTDDDIADILSVRNTIGKSRHALKVYYEFYVHFFAQFCHMNMIQFILKEMKNDEIPLSRFSYNSITQYYVANAKFILLSKFLDKFVSRYILFEPIYVKQLFDAFITTYPYRGEKFAVHFNEWLRSNNLLTNTEKLLIADECQISTSKSRMTPCTVKKPTLEKSKKYNQSGWSSIKQGKGKSIAKVQRRHQVQFRMLEGIREVMRKGVRPDYHVIENTLRNLNATLRQGILETLPKMRMKYSASRLSLHHFLLAYPQKDDYEKFVRENSSQLNTSDRLLLARRSMNSYAYETASHLLNTLAPVDMTDSRHMITLNLKLRNNMFLHNFKDFVKEIEKFPIDEITLSPYIYNQCRYIEKSLRRMLARNKPGDSLEYNTAKHLALEKLKGLIGDIEVRLKKDENDISKFVNDAFQMLSAWIKRSRSHDERRV